MLRAAVTTFTVGFVPTLALGQGPLQESPGVTRPELPSFEPPEPEPGFILPPLPIPKEPDTGGVSGGLEAYVKEVRFSGNTALSDSELQQIAQPYTNRTLSWSDLEALRDAVTLAYVNRGYVSSGAVIPEQSLVDQILEIQIVEGVLSEIRIENDGRFSDRYLRDRLRLGADAPINLRALEQQLQILQQDPRIESVHAALNPGEARGESVLDVKVTERPPYRVILEGNNYQSPAIGSERGRFIGLLENMTGFGDSLTAMYTGSEGANEGEGYFRIPLNRYDTTLELHTRAVWSEIVEEPFDDLDIESRTQTYGITLRQPVYRSLTTTLEAFVTGEYQRSKSFLLGQGFAFTQGPSEDGVSKVAVIRFGQVFTRRARNQVFALRSQLSWGIDALGATKHRGDIPDGQFVAWLGQAQWARRFPLLNAQLIARVDAQLTNNPLLGIEQLAIGGRDTVRGYRENTLVRDNGLVGSLELRVPLFMDTQDRPRLEIGPFVDAGYSWNQDRQEFGPTTLVSVGTAARWYITGWLRFDAAYGHRIKDVPDGPDWNLQNEGVHLGLTLEFPP